MSIKANTITLEDVNAALRGCRIEHNLRHYSATMQDEDESKEFRLDHIEKAGFSENFNIYSTDNKEPEMMITKNVLDTLTRMGTYREVTEKFESTIRIFVN